MLILLLESEHFRQQQLVQTMDCLFYSNSLQYIILIYKLYGTVFPTTKIVSDMYFFNRDQLRVENE